MKHHALHSDTAILGFQIAPMIDVVFVIMLFFMVLVGSMKMEHQIGLRLPSPEGANASLDVRFPDTEVTLGVLEDGTVTLNDEAFDSPDDKALPALTQTLRRLALSSERQGDKVLATIQAEEVASYDRVIDVLNALHKAQIQNVTFVVGSAF